MIEKSELKKLDKKQLIDKVIKLSDKLKKERWITIGISLPSFIVAIILLIAHVTPMFCGIQVMDGGENIELNPYNKQEGEWWISFRTTGFIPTKNIILHVEFLDEYAVINYTDMYFNVFPSGPKAEYEYDNEFEYRWDSYMGNIVVGIRSISINSTMHELFNSTRVTISTDGGIEYRFPVV